MSLGIAAALAAPRASARSLIFDLSRAEADYAQEPAVALLATRDGDERLALVLRTPFELRFPGVEAARGAMLTFAVGEAAEPAARVAVGVSLRLDGERTAVWSGTLGPESSGWTPAAVDLSRAHGRRVEVVLEGTSVEGGEAMVGFSGLELERLEGRDGHREVLVVDLKRDNRAPGGAGESLSAVVEVPPGAELVLDAERPRGSPATGEATVGIDVEGVPSTFTLAGSARGFTRRLDLSPWARRKAKITVRFESADPAAAIDWHRLRVVTLEETGSRKPPEEPVEDVLLLLVDTLRADRVGAYGHDGTSPHLDRLSRQGKLFEKVRAQAPWTTPSVASLMSGQYPHEVAGKTWGQHAARKVMAERFAESGRATVAISANPFIGSDGGFDRGFADFVVARMARAELVNDLFAAWLDGHRARPFFAYLHYLDPHYPYKPPAPFDNFAASRRRFRTSQAVDAGPPEMKEPDEPAAPPEPFEQARRVRLDERERAAIAATYGAEVTAWDHELGALLRSLRRRGTLERTSVVVTADHGEEFMEHGCLGHGQQLFDESLHVPLVVRSPRAAPGSRDAVPVELRHAGALLATLLRLPGWEGQGQGASFASLYRPVGSGKIVWALTEGRFKYIETRSEGKLFDLEADPAELRDVSARHPDVRTRMKRALAKLRSEAAEPPPEADPELQEHLEALGYVGARAD